MKSSKNSIRTSPAEGSWKVKPTVSLSVSTASPFPRQRPGLRQSSLLQTDVFKMRNKHGESERDSDPKPRVARDEQPWENIVRTLPTPTGLCLPLPCPQAPTVG